LLLLPFFGTRELPLERTELKTGERKNSSEKSSSFAQNPQIPTPEQGENRGFQRFRVSPWLQLTSSHLRLTHQE
jgi:hypothetical protein